jgi:hypothetical protein
MNIKPKVLSELITHVISNYSKAAGNNNFGAAKSNFITVYEQLLELNFFIIGDVAGI